MRTFFYSVLMMCALFTSQNVNAQEAKEIFSETFETGLGDFTVEGDPVWSHSIETSIPSARFMSQSMSIDFLGYTYLVSPVIENGTQTTLSFTHAILGLMNGGFEETAKVCVREEGGNWTKIEGVNFPVGFDQFVGTFTESGVIAIPAEFDNKKIQIAFGAEPIDASCAAGWYINNLVVNSVAGETVDPQPETGDLYSVAFDSKANVDTWTVEGFFAANPGNLVTFHENLKAMQILGDGMQEKELTESFVVSPIVKLAAAGNKVTFNHTCMDNTASGIDALSALVVRVEGGEWVEIPGITHGTNWREFVNAGEFEVPAEFNGKSVQFGFKYLWDGGNNVCNWYIKDFKVFADATTGIQNVENTIVDNKYYDLQGRVVENPSNGLYIINGKKVVIK